MGADCNVVSYLCFCAVNESVKKKKLKKDVFCCPYAGIVLIHQENLIWENLVTFFKFISWHFHGFVSPLAAPCYDFSHCWGFPGCRLAESLIPCMRPQHNFTEIMAKKSFFPQATKHRSQTLRVASLKTNKEYKGCVLSNPTATQLLPGHPRLPDFAKHRGRLRLWDGATV